MKKLKARSYSDFSKGTWANISESLAPDNSVKYNINLDSDKILGELVSRDGTTRVGNQLVSGAKCLGLHNFRDTVGSGSKLFSVFSDGVNSDIYDTVGGTKSLQDDTKDNKTRFLTYLDSCLRLNGTDAPKAWNGSAWVTTGGAFDLSNIPAGTKYAIEFKDRVIIAGRTDSPDRVDISGIANATSRTVSWTVDNRFFLAEQEDGGGAIQGLGKVPGYVLIFKRYSMKRYDLSSAYPEDMVNQGIPSQEAFVTAKGMGFFLNENGVWVTAGGDPKLISTNTVDGIIRSISSTDLENVHAGTDEVHVFFSIPSATIDGETHNNVVLKYNIFQNSWDIREYPTFLSFFTKYVDGSGKVSTVAGDSNGNVLKLDTGNSDNGDDIVWTVITQDDYFGFRLYRKGIPMMGVITENAYGKLLWRDKNRYDDWQDVGAINDEVSVFRDIDLRAVRYNFKLTGVTNSGAARIKSIEIPAGTNLYDNE